MVNHLHLGSLMDVNWILMDLDKPQFTRPEVAKMAKMAKISNSKAMWFFIIDEILEIYVEISWIMDNE